MGGAWFLGDHCLFQGLKGRLSYSLENKRTGRVAEEPRGIWEGVNRPLDKSKWAGRGSQLGVGHGRREEWEEGLG